LQLGSENSVNTIVASLIPKLMGPNCLAGGRVVLPQRLVVHWDLVVHRKGW